MRILTALILTSSLLTAPVLAQQWGEEQEIPAFKSPIDI